MSSTDPPDPSEARWFRRPREVNALDRLVVDVPALYARFPVTTRAEWDAPIPDAREFLPLRLYRSRLLPFRARLLAWLVLHRLRLDLGWFEQFRTYWSGVLGGRPLWGVQDFDFLRGSYRLRSQDNQVPDTDDALHHLEAWQQPELLYQVFHQVYVESQRPQMAVFAQLQRLGLWPLRSFLEFGCATAPIATTFSHFFAGWERTRIYLSDVETLAFHYAIFRFRHTVNVAPVLLRPESGFSLVLEHPVDVIFCMAVFEHLNQPLARISEFHRALAPDGILVFDYAKGEGEGLDTLHGVRERAAVLDFLAEHFEILFGRIDADRTMPLTIARKRS